MSIEIQVIDTPEVRLLSYTQNSLSLIYAAFRECYHKHSAVTEWDKYLNEDKAVMKKFIQNVLESGHETPIEHVSFTFAINGISRVCSHQIVRSRIASFSQRSQRVEKKDVFRVVIPREIKLDSTRYKIFLESVERDLKSYKSLIDKGVAIENARYLLPNCIETSLVMTMNCRSLLHFFKLRCCNRAQEETREVAYKMLSEVKKVLPEIFEHAGPACEMYGYCPETKRFSCGKVKTLEEIRKELNL